MSKITIGQLMNLHDLKYDEQFKVVGNHGLYKISFNELLVYNENIGWVKSQNILHDTLANKDIIKQIPWIPKENESIWVIDVNNYIAPYEAVYEDLSYQNEFDMGLVFKKSDEEKAQKRYDMIVEWLKETRVEEME